MKPPNISQKFAAACVLLVGIAFFAGRWAYPAIGHTSSFQRDFSASAVPAEGNQLVMVYVGSSRCGACRSPDLPDYVARIRASLDSTASAKTIGFVTIGVASELSPGQGLLHLERIGSFDELDAGQGKLNQANLHFVARDHTGLQATPQVVVLLRTLREDPSGALDQSLTTERVLVRKIGLRELELWFKQGVPLPRLDNLM